MPENQTEKRKVDRGFIRSSEIESRKLLYNSTRIKYDTAIRSSKVEEGKTKTGREQKATK